MFAESITGRLYYKIKVIPLIRLFFDFDYASEIWNKSYTKNLTKLILEKIGNKIKFKSFRLNENIFITLLGFCPYLGLWTGSLWHIFLLTAFLSISFLFYSQSEQLKYVIFYEAVITVLFAPFIRLNAFDYIIYVETAVILFFIIKNLNNNMFLKLIKTVTVFWFLQCIFIKGNEEALIISFLPYALCSYKKRNIKRHLYIFFTLCTGLYAMSAFDGATLIGGGVGILVMAIFGEWRLFLPILIVSPWIVEIGLKIVREGLSKENIIRTGYFFWNRSFKGISLDYNNISHGDAGIFVTLFFSIISFVFFWYVIRVSRQAVLKIFDRSRKNKSLLRAGLGCVIGFSLYTFFGKTGTVQSNILIYLWNCAMLKRLCSIK